MENNKAKRWRAQKGEHFYFIDKEMDTSFWYDLGDESDDILFEHGNYFRTRKEALKVAEEVKKALKRYHNELRDFEWALQKMREGLRVKRLAWGRYYPSHVFLDPRDNSIREVIMANNDFFYLNEVYFSSYDILATDWELYV